MFRLAAALIMFASTILFGPVEPMMHSPEVMNMARAMGDYLRYHSAIGNTLSELVMTRVAQRAL